MDVDVVDSDADLTSIQELAEEDTVYCSWNHSGLVDNGRAFTAQL